MLNDITPYVGFTAAGLVLMILAVDRHLRASRARAVVALRVPAQRSTQRPARGPVRADADITQRLPVIVLAPAAAGHVEPPLPPVTFRRPPVPLQRPACRPPDRPATPRSEARLITPWGDVTRLPGSDEPGVVPSTLAGVGR